MREKLKRLDAKIQSIIKRFRIKYYHEFAISVFSFGFAIIYMLYVCVRIPVLTVHLDTTMPFNITQSTLALDLAGIFFALKPVFELLSSVMLLGGFLWATLKLFSHSLVKISEIELVPLPERILDIEKEGEKSNDE